MSDDVEERRRQQRAEAQRRYRARHPEKARQRVRDWNARNREASAAASKRWSHENRARSHFLQLRGNAKSRGVEFALTFEEFEALLAPMTCSVTRLALAHREGERGPFSPSFDRVDSSVGYLPGNVRLVCLMYNMMKYVWTDEDCLAVARGIVSGADG